MLGNVCDIEGNNVVLPALLWICYLLQDVHWSTTIPDASGKKMRALDVFSEAIGYLKRHVMKQCDERGFDLSDREIKWILTVPAIWGDAAKQFMRKAAEKVLIVDT